MIMATSFIRKNRTLEVKGFIDAFKELDDSHISRENAQDLDNLLVALMKEPDAEDIKASHEPAAMLVKEIMKVRSVNMVQVACGRRGKRGIRKKIR